MRMTAGLSQGRFSHPSRRGRIPGPVGHPGAIPIRAPFSASLQLPASELVASEHAQVLVSLLEWDLRARPGRLANPYPPRGKRRQGWEARDRSSSALAVRLKFRCRPAPARQGQLHASLGCGAVSRGLRNRPSSEPSLEPPSDLTEGSPICSRTRRLTMSTIA